MIYPRKSREANSDRSDSQQFFAAKYRVYDTINDPGCMIMYKLQNQTLLVNLKYAKTKQDYHSQCFHKRPR
jgi:hypothetical protein